MVVATTIAQIHKGGKVWKGGREVNVDGSEIGSINPFIMWIDS